MSLMVEQIKPAVGAIIRVDRSELLSKDVAQQTLSLIEKHGVVVFPRVGLTDQEQQAFTENLGASVNFTTSAPGGDKANSGGYNITLDPKINNEPEYVQGTFFWHLDGMPMANIPPPKASVLSCRKKSEVGGQTEFASTFAAYDGLTDEEKAEYSKLRVLHSLMAGVREVKSFDELQPHMRIRKAERPLVWTYPSGRKSLLIGYTADEVVGRPKAEGRALLARLLEWAAQPAYSYRHQWQEGDLVVWDNCGALHRVVPYATNSGRLMHRTSVAGTELVA
jgi:alpha-ketoglutarate-dependent taurine dioxygenase